MEKKKQTHKIKGYEIQAHSLEDAQKKLDGYYLLKSITELNK